MYDRKKLSARCYELLLHVYPKAFQNEFGPLLRQTFGDMLVRAGNSTRFGSIALLWCRTLRDLISSAIDQYLARDSRVRFVWSWIVACTAGPAVGGIFLLVPTLGPIVMFRMWHWAWGVPAINPVTQPVPFPRPPRMHAIVTIAEMAAVIAMGLGWLQSRTLTWQFRWRVSWIVSTMMGVATGWPLLFAFNSGSMLWASIVAYRPLVFPAALFVCGLIIGLSQSVVLSFKTSRAWLWLPTCAVATILAGLAGAMLETAMPTLSIFVIGATFGLVTALPMAWILESQSRRFSQTSS